MGKKEFELARKATRELLSLRNIEDHMFHGPVSERYWLEPFRLVAVNMESYGYDGHCEVDRKMLIDWLYDAGNTDTRTARRTFAILAVLHNRIAKKETASWAAVQTAYADEFLLEDTLERTVYFNIRPQSNEIKEQNVSAIQAVGGSELGPFIWNELRALDAHVILVSGEAGLAALNGVSRLSPPLLFRAGVTHPEGVFIQSISHPSRPHYDEWAAMAEEVAGRIEGTKGASIQHSLA